MRIQKLNKKRYLGKLCDYGHEYKSTGKSIRYKSCKTCCVCNAISVEDRKSALEEYRNVPKHKKKMKKYQKNYRDEKRRKDEKEYQANYYLTVTKPKREREAL